MDHTILHMDKNLARTHIVESHKAGAAMIVDQIARMPREGQLDAAVMRAQAGDKRAAEQVLAWSVAYADHIAQQIYMQWHARLTADTTYDDAFQAGVSGLLHAITKYNPERGSFLNYAKMWITSRVQRGVIFPGMTSWKAGEDAVRYMDADDPALAIGTSSLSVLTDDAELQRLAMPAHHENYHETIDAEIMLDACRAQHPKLAQYAQAISDGYTERDAARITSLGSAGARRMVDEAARALDSQLSPL